MFEPFYRPQGHRDEEGGVGLVLALVRRIAEHHRAEIRLEGPGSVGTRLTVRW